MMFALMQKSGLFPPMYRELREHAQEALVVSLSNEEQPPVWTQVSDWIDRKRPISNNVLCEIAGLDTLNASKLLKKWVAQGMVADQTRAKRNMVYTKADIEGSSNQELLSFALDNNGD
jgi:ATP-dependent DNA helicase RecG